MSVAEGAHTGIAGTARILSRRLPAVDLGWRNIVFAIKTAAAAILAMAIAYWLDLSDPQWASLTVFVLAQSTAGAALAKGVWRSAGTVGGGLFGLLLVGLFSEAPELLVAATVLAIGASFYAGARLRNFSAYGAMLGGYTALLIAYEGSADPLNAWSIAADRIFEILIGIACGTLASTIILPRHAGDALRAALHRTLDDLTRYVATALRLSAPIATFAAMRSQMVGEVVSFDALRSYAMFETADMRADQQRLKRIVRQFLVALASGRALYLRLDAFEGDGAEAILAKLRPTLDMIAARLEALADDPDAWRDLRQLRRERAAARRALGETMAALEAMAGSVPFDPLANGLLILGRVRDLLRGLAMVFVAEAASLHGADVAMAKREPAPPDPEGRREALLIAIRAGLAILLLSLGWLATGWDEGFTAVSGGAIILFFGVNQDDPRKGARAYLLGSVAGIVIAYAAMVFVLPHLEGFTALAIVLMLLLVPAGLMIGTPAHSMAGIALGAFTISEIGTGNLFAPDETAYVNSGVALILGMVLCLAVIAAMPVDSRARRGALWRRTIGAILPGVARGAIVPRRGADEIGAMLAALLPRFSFDRQRDEDFFRGSLGAASTAIELGRLARLASDPAMPADARRVIGDFLSAFAVALEVVAAQNHDRERPLAEAEALVDTIRSDLAARALGDAPGARSLLHAGAALRFIADRFSIDRAYFALSLDGE